MFGYVVVNKPELKIREYDTYKEYYCGLCHALKKYHGAKSQMCLAYDYVFLLLLFSGLYEPDETKVPDMEVEIWQYSDKGVVEGIEPLVDLNAWVPSTEE